MSFLSSISKAAAGLVLAAGMTARHLAEGVAPLEADGLVTERAEVCEVATWTAAEVEDGVRARPLERAEQRRVVLRDVVLAGPFPEALGVRLVMLERPGRGRERRRGRVGDHSPSMLDRSPA